MRTTCAVAAVLYQLRLSHVVVLRHSKNSSVLLRSVDIVVGDARYSEARW